MVLMDELPLRSLLDHSGQIDRRLYPNFAKLAGQSTWYRNATAVIGADQAGPCRRCSPAAIRPRTWPPIAARYPNNLFRLLGGS